MSRPDYRIETALADLATHIDWPDHADVTPRVRARLTEPIATSSWWSRRRLAVAITAAVVVLAVLVVPPAREAVAELLGISGIELGFTEEIPESDATIDLGERITIDQADASVDFDLLVPADGVGPPDGFYRDDREQVTMVWIGGPSLPAAGDTGVGLIYTQFRAQPGETFYLKELGPRTGVETVAVRNSPGYWLRGASHTVRYVDASGQIREEDTHLAANVLLWESGGVSHRIETTLSLEQALDVAQSLMPAE